MMQLRNWQRSKIMATKVDTGLCKDNVLSDVLLSIILGDGVSGKEELANEVSLLVHGYIDTIIDGLSRKRSNMNDIS